MVPTFIRVTSILKGLIEEKVKLGESNINITPYMSKTTLDIIGLVGEGKNDFFFNFTVLHIVPFAIISPPSHKCSINLIGFFFE